MRDFTAHVPLPRWDREQDFDNPPTSTANGHAGEPPPPPPNGPEEYGLSADSITELAPAPDVVPRFVPVLIDAVTVSAEPIWAIQGLVPARGLVCIVGPPKSGKSFLTADMFFSIARGVPYAGRETKQGPVIYLTGEGVQGFKRRMIAMRRHYGVEGQGVQFAMIENVPDLGSSATDLPILIRDLDQFIERAGGARPRAIVLDTLARCMGEGDENVARDMGRFVNRCGVIERHFGCLVAVVHHMGKDASKGARGSNALHGALDVYLTVEKGDTSSTVRVEEMKDGPEGQEWRFRLVPYQADRDDEQRSISDTPEASTEASTCVVELLSEPTLAKHGETKKSKPPRGVAGDLLKIIRRAVHEAGEVNVGAGTVPDNVRAASRNTLKSFCKTMDWQDPDEKPDAFRAALSRNLSALRDATLIGYSRDWIWLI